MWPSINKHEPTFLDGLGNHFFPCVPLLCAGSMNGGFQNLAFRGQLSKCCSYPNGPPGGAARATTTQVASQDAVLMAMLAAGGDW